MKRTGDSSVTSHDGHDRHCQARCQESTWANGRILVESIFDRLGTQFLEANCRYPAGTDGTAKDWHAIVRMGGPNNQELRLPTLVVLAKIRWSAEGWDEEVMFADSYVDERDTQQPKPGFGQRKFANGPVWQSCAGGSEMLVSTSGWGPGDGSTESWHRMPSEIWGLDQNRGVPILWVSPFWRSLLALTAGKGLSMDDHGLGRYGLVGWAD